ncbi:MAG: metallophosphoesterase, partial [Methanoregulaceae archaeon]|nr:metallophosphoesterase [Methanoregulaceae archaeon]
VPGNCDPRDILDVLEQSDCVSLHAACMSLGLISVIGIGGSNPTPFNTPFELTDKQIEDILQTNIHKRELAVHNVLISHAPPFGILDQAGGNHVGSKSVREHLHEFDLVCCAHIHEDKGIADVDGVRVVNPGMAAAGDCAMIHFGNEPKDIRIELFTV